MRSFKKIVAVVSIFCIVTFFPLTFVHGAAGTPFGGLDLFYIPCTCTAGSVSWNPFFPFYLAGQPIFAALVVSVVPLAYEYYRVIPTAWALGYYTPGAGICYVGVEPYCYSLPNYGLLTPYSGASLPGF